MSPPEPERWVYIIRDLLIEIRNGRCYTISAHDLDWLEALAKDAKWLVEHVKEKEET